VDQLSDAELRQGLALYHLEDFSNPDSTDGGVKVAVRDTLCTVMDKSQLVLTEEELAHMNDLAKGSDEGVRGQQSYDEIVAKLQTVKARQQAAPGRSLALLRADYRLAKQNSDVEYKALYYGLEGRTVALHDCHNINCIYQGDVDKELAEVAELRDACVSDTNHKAWYNAANDKRWGYADATDEGVQANIEPDEIELMMLAGTQFGEIPGAKSYRDPKDPETKSQQEEWTEMLFAKDIAFLESQKKKYDTQQNQAQADLVDFVLFSNTVQKRMLGWPIAAEDKPKVVVVFPIGPDIDDGGFKKGWTQMINRAQEVPYSKSGNKPRSRFATLDDVSDVKYRNLTEEKLREKLAALGELVPPNRDGKSQDEALAEAMLLPHGPKQDAALREARSRVSASSLRIQLRFLENRNKMQKEDELAQKQMQEANAAQWDAEAKANVDTQIAGSEEGTRYEALAHHDAATATRASELAKIGNFASREVKFSDGHRTLVAADPALGAQPLALGDKLYNMAPQRLSRHSPATRAQAIANGAGYVGPLTPNRELQRLLQPEQAQPEQAPAATERPIYPLVEPAPLYEKPTYTRNVFTKLSDGKFTVEPSALPYPGYNGAGSDR